MSKTFGFHSGVANAKAYATPVITLSARASGAVSLPFDRGSVFAFVPTESCTLYPEGGAKGQEAILIVTTSGTGSFNLTPDAAMTTAGVLATGTSDAKTFVLKFVNDGSKWCEVSRTSAM